MIYRDEVIAEVWKNRDAYVARHHNNLDEMVADLHERQNRSGCKLVDRRDLCRLKALKPAEGQPSKV